MKTFLFEVQDSDRFFPVLKGSIQANSEREAIHQLQDEYAYELDTEPQYILVNLKEEGIDKNE